MARYEPLDLNTLENDEIKTKLFAIRDSLGVIFQPYQRLQLAIVSETVVDDSQQPQVGIHCYWQDSEFLCKKKDLRGFQNIEGLVPNQLN